MASLIQKSAGQTQNAFNYPERLDSAQINSLIILGKIWGFLKYYHPTVTSGAYDWDSVLFTKIPQVVSNPAPQMLNHMISHWLEELGTVKDCCDSGNNFSDSNLLNPDTSWIYNSGFDKELTGKFSSILNNKIQHDQYFVAYGSSGQVKVTNEKYYLDVYNLSQKPEYRILCLFRYWNIVNYFSPYKYICSNNWDVTLDKFIPIFYSASDTLQYSLSIEKLVDQLEDGHTALTWNASLINYFGYFGIMPFGCTLVNDTAIVTHLYNDSLCKQEGINRGDAIVSVDGETIGMRFKHFAPYISSSNERARLVSFGEFYLFRGKDSICTIEKMENNRKIRIHIKRYSSSVPVFQNSYGNLDRRSWNLLEHNIGYVDMGLLQPNEVKAMMDSLQNTKAIIFDIRNYPNDTWPAITERLSDKPFVMSKVSIPDIHCPGIFRFSKDQYFGRLNSNSYQGKVVILVNELKKSHAEFTAMGIQAATKTTTLGSQSAGADGNITDWIPLPGGIRTKFSGLGIYYPDGTIAQKKGVKIDIPIEPSLIGLISGKDEVLKAAINFIESEGKK